ncbi:MAG: MFS transporter [Cyanobacteria bacterium]|nr:MFS transporter [Cyanobacteriota bacterium]MDW8202775.1 MFS transporter [Cyanobacteriota bacterium SKYGB_h_bin112]
MQTGEMESSEADQSILWRQVWGLAALLAAIVMSWIAYGLYQPKVLVQLGFLQLASSLGVMQGLLGAVIEPMVGAYSDRIMQRLGNRLPIISVGVTLAGLLFVATAVALRIELPSGWRWLIPVMMTLWVIAMIIFRGPAIALLRQFAPVKALPQANAVLTLVFSLAASLGPILGELLDRLGASLTFVAGAIVLMAAATVLYRALPRHTIATLPVVDTVPYDRLRSALTFLVGLGVGSDLNLLLETVPKTANLQLPLVTTGWIASGVLLIAAITALPLGQIVAKLGSKSAMMTGLGAIAISLGLSTQVGSPELAIANIVIAGSSFGLVLISMVPYALELVPLSQAGWSTGLYFGGAGLSGVIVPYLAGSLPTLVAASIAIAIVTIIVIAAVQSHPA